MREDAKEVYKTGPGITPQEKKARNEEFVTNWRQVTIA